MGKVVVAAVQDVELRCHSVSSCAAISSIRVTVQRLTAMRLQLVYRVTGDLAQLRIPDLRPAQRRDELWRHSCVELFVAIPEHVAYTEFNFAPSSCWAAYEFSDYRQGMRQATVAAPVIAVKQSERVLEIDARVELPEQFAATDILQASVTAVIEDHAGAHCYWAARHATAKPDFHHRDSFVINI